MHSAQSFCFDSVNVLNILTSRRGEREVRRLGGGRPGAREGCHCAAKVGERTPWGSSSPKLSAASSVPSTPVRSTLFVVFLPLRLSLCMSLNVHNAKWICRPANFAFVRHVLLPSVCAYGVGRWASCLGRAVNGVTGVLMMPPAPPPPHTPPVLSVHII